MGALLPQAGGFEGLLSLKKHLVPDREAVSECPHLEQLEVEFEAFVPALPQGLNTISTRIATTTAAAR